MKESALLKELQAARAGSEVAIAAIIAKKMPLIRRYAWRARTPGLDFEDAVQEGLIGLFHAVRTYNQANKASFSTYASVCIQNAILSARKAAGRKKHQPLNQSIPLPEAQSTPGPEEQAIANEQITLTLEKAKTRLSSLEKDVLSLYLDGLSYEQIAHELGRTTKTVDNALGRLRRKLK